MMARGAASAENELERHPFAGSVAVLQSAVSTRCAVEAYLPAIRSITGCKASRKGPAVATSQSR